MALLLFTVVLTFVIGAICASYSPLQKLIWRPLGLCQQDSASSPKCPPPHGDNNDRSDYIECLMHQLEITKTLQRVIIKTDSDNAGPAAARDKLHHCLELRMALLTTELCAQEAMASSGTSDGRPDWKALQKGYRRVIAQQYRRFSDVDLDKNEALAYADAVLAMPPNDNVETETGQQICAFTRQIEQLRAALSKSEKQVELLETKLSLAQKKIDSLQWSSEQADDKRTTKRTTRPRPTQLRQSGS